MNLKLFISWSGEKSREIAVVLREWLPMVMQSIKPYVSSEDIFKGGRWSNDVSSELQDSNFGIIVVTKENVYAPWIQFEAGALSKSMSSSRVCPILIDVKISEISEPFKQFQATTFRKDDVKKLIVSINKANHDAELEEKRLEAIYETMWQHLEEKIIAIDELYTSKEQAAPIAESTSTNDIIEEILDLSRQQHILIKDKFGDELNREKGFYVPFELFDQLNVACREVIKLYNSKNKLKENEKKILTTELYQPLKSIENPLKVMRELRQNS
ncbi:hypothetical protein BK124_00625 [Paenibacillus amylolyticus]|nr:hypothetical protein BK124_00625 [Paenibacillus amylolyticus]